MQSTSTAFDNHTKGVSRRPKQKVTISWDRSKDATIDFAVVGTSLVDGNDVVQGEFTEITENDLFVYTDESDYTQEWSIDRQLPEPLGGMVFGIGDLKLINTNKRFTPDFDGTIGAYVDLPNRPIKIFGGFRVLSNDTLLPLLYGLSGLPKESKSGKDVSIEVKDYISIIKEYKLESDTTYKNQRVDQIIADILATIGFNVNQYELDEARNTIGFAYFPKGTKAGNVINKLCESEDGMFFQNELGIIRFQNRHTYLNAPYNASVWDIDKDFILEWEKVDGIGIINRVEIKSSPRVVQENVEIWRAGEIFELERKQTRTVWANFDDPVDLITTPASTTDYVANTQSDGSGSNVTGSLNVTVSKFVTSTRFTLENTTDQTMYVTLLRLRGNPAVVLSPIYEIVEDTDSIDTYGVQSIEIENDFIDDSAFALQTAQEIVRKYSQPSGQVVITIPAIPQVQVKDWVRVKDPDTDTYTDYRVLRNQLALTPDYFLQKLYLREIDNSETTSPAIVGATVVGADQEVVWFT